MCSKRLAFIIGFLSMALLIAAACTSDAQDELVVTVSPPPKTMPPDPVNGEKVFGANGCSACHSTGANKVIGPGLAGILARAESRGTGQTAEEYIRTSIIDPGALVVEEFSDNVMPSTFGTSISDSDLQDLIAYLSTLHCDVYCAADFF